MQVRTPRRETPSRDRPARATTAAAPGRTGAAGGPFLASGWRVAALAAALLLAAAPAAGAGFRFVTDNDFLADDGDDLYSFGVGLELHRDPYTLTLEESGFTDRAAGTRFDETILTLGRPLTLPGGWQGWVELGLARVGEGLLGQSFQNELHRLIEADELRLRYVGEERLHAASSFTATRLQALLPQLAAGPYVELAVAPGLKSHALAAAQASWDPRGPWALAALLGARTSHASFAPLEPHMGGTALQAELAVVYRDRLALSWSYNASGTRQDHLALGYRVGAALPVARALTR